MTGRGQQMAGGPKGGAAKPGTTRIILNQAGAFGRGALDEASLGAADWTNAARRAIDLHGWNGYRRRLDVELARERAKDAYDAAHYEIARNVGRAAGFGATLVGTGGAGAGAR